MEVRTTYLGFDGKAEGDHDVRDSRNKRRHKSQMSFLVSLPLAFPSLIWVMTALEALTPRCGQPASP